jgi:hypothetical protein
MLRTLCAGKPYPSTYLGHTQQVTTGWDADLTNRNWASKRGSIQYRFSGSCYPQQAGDSMHPDTGKMLWLFCRSKLSAIYPLKTVLTLDAIVVKEDLK